jgi:hypothetical protein
VYARRLDPSVFAFSLSLYLSNERSQSHVTLPSHTTGSVGTVDLYVIDTTESHGLFLEKKISMWSFWRTGINVPDREKWWMSLVQMLNEEDEVLELVHSDRTNRFYLNPFFRLSILRSFLLRPWWKPCEHWGMILCLPSGGSIDRIRDHRGHVHHGFTIQSTLTVRTSHCELGETWWKPWLSVKIKLFIPWLSSFLMVRLFPYLDYHESVILRKNNLTGLILIIKSTYKSWYVSLNHNHSTLWRLVDSVVWDS